MSDEPLRTETSAAHTPIVRRMEPRDPNAAHRVATPLELFFDLVFVVAIAQAASGLHHAVAENHAAGGIGSYLMVFFAIWWAWMNFTWFASAYDCDDALYRVTVFVELTGALILAAGVSQAFDTLDFTTVTIGYAVMRAGIIANWIRAALGDPLRRTTALRYAGGLVVVQPLWIALLWAPAPSSLPGFFTLVAAELAIPIWAERAGPTPWHRHHIAERYGLLSIIVLGESVLAATVSIQTALAGGESLSTLLPTIGGGLLVLYSMWWLYFDRPVHDLLTDMGRAFVWGYGHYFVYASAAAVGAGLAVNTDFVTDHAEISATAAGASVAVPAAGYLLVLWLLHHRPREDAVEPTWLAPAAILLLLATPWAPQPVLACGLVLSALLVVKLLVRHRPARRGAAVVIAALVVSGSGCGERPASDPAGQVPGSTEQLEDSAGAEPRVGSGGEAPGGSVAEGPDVPSTWAYVCSDGLRFTVHFREGEARAELPSRGLVLPSAGGGSDALFEGADALLRPQGDGAVLELEGDRHEACEGERAVSSEDAARLIGFEFRGLGQEPGWLVDVDPDRQIRWVGDYGDVRFAAAPGPSERTDSSVVWRGVVGEHSIVVEAVERACRDAMSGRPFTHTVRVDSDGREYRGCGRWLGAGS